MDKRVKESLKEVNNKSIQTYLKERRVVINKANGFDQNDHLRNKKNVFDEKKEKVKSTNLFECLPQFNNSLYKNSIKKEIKETQKPQLITIDKLNNQTKEGIQTSQKLKLPLIGNLDQSRANESIRRSSDFCQNTTQISSLGNYFNSPIKANNNLSDMKISLNPNSNRGTTLAFNIENTYSKPKLTKNNSQIYTKTVKSHYEENFKSKYSLFNKKIQKWNNISDSGISYKNTIIDKIGNFKKTIRDLMGKHYLSTENFNQISPRKAKFHSVEGNHIY